MPKKHGLLDHLGFPNLTMKLTDNGKQATMALLFRTTTYRGGPSSPISSVFYIVLFFSPANRHA